MRPGEGGEGGVGGERMEEAWRSCCVGIGVGGKSRVQFECASIIVEIGPCLLLWTMINANNDSFWLISFFFEIEMAMQSNTFISKSS